MRRLAALPALPAALVLAGTLAAPAAPAAAAVGDPVPTTTTFNPPYDGGEMSAWVNEPEVEGERAPEGEVEFLVDGEVLGTAELSPRSYRDGVWGEATLPDTAPKRRTVVLRARYLPDEGWAASQSDTYERVPPTLLASLDAAGVPTSSGWFNVPVTVVWTCLDGSSAVGACPEPLQVRRGREVVRRTLSAEDGGLDSTRTEVKVDRVAPIVSAERRPGRAPRCLATDALSGVDSCTRVLSSPSTSLAGVRRRAFEMVAVDKAGNTASVSGSYRVR